MQTRQDRHGYREHLPKLVPYGVNHLPLSKGKVAAMNGDERIFGDQFLVFSLGEEGGYALGDLSHLEIVGLLDIVRP